MSEGSVGKLAAAALAAALFISGCAAAPVNPPQDPRIGEMQDDIQRIKRVLSEQRGVATGAPGWDRELGKKLAELDEKLRQIDLENQATKGKIEELERGLSDLKTAKESREPDRASGEIAGLSARVDAISERVTTMNRSLEGLAQQLQKNGAAPALPAQPAAPPKSPKETYDEAYALYRDNKYAEAQARFKEYVDRYPDTALADNAIFWIGEAYYDQGQYEQAILQYDRVVQKYPGGDKVASSLLKQAFSFAAMGDNVSARILLKKVMQEHAGSEQALIAKKKLEVLGE